MVIYFLLVLIKQSLCEIFSIEYILIFTSVTAVSEKSSLMQLANDAIVICNYFKTPVLAEMLEAKVS